MKKYKVTWYNGSIESEHSVLDSKEVEAEDINKVQYLDILPEDTREKVYYTRGVLFDPEKWIVIDYGSWFNFISIREVE